MLVAHLIDALADRLFEARNEPAGDILAFRGHLAAAHPAVAIVFDVVAGRAQLVTEPVEVPVAEYNSLSVEDFMVSLYNQHTVQRLRIATGDTRYDVHEVLAAALAALDPPPRSGGGGPA